MKSRVSWVGVVLAAMLAAASVSHAADEDAASESGYRPGVGGIGGQLGGSLFIADGDYSSGAGPRFSLSAHWRYVMTPSWRWQVSPGFLWAGYDDKEPVPFRDLNFPNDSTKGEYLSLLTPITAQLQYTQRRGPWLMYVGAGSGVYRVWVQNRRKVLKDPTTFKLHRGLYPGVSAQLGAERFLKVLPSTSIELAFDGHWVFAQRDEQFPSGFNSFLSGLELRVGGNYYFIPNETKKKKGSELPIE